jgi:WD40 repeat protein
MGAQSSVLPSDRARLREKIFVKLHNSLQGQCTSLESKLRKLISQVDADAEGCIGMEQIAIIAQKLCIAPLDAASCAKLSLLTGADANNKVNCQNFVNFVLEPVHQLRWLKKFDKAAALRYKASKAQETNRAEAAPLSEGVFNAKSAVGSLQRLLRSNQTEIGRHPALIYQLCANEPDSSYAAKCARTSGKWAELKAVPHLLLGRKNQESDPCLSCAEQEDEVQALCTFQDGSPRVVIAVKKCVRVWNTETLAGELDLGGHKADVMCCAVSADGRYLLSGDEDEKLWVWDLKAAGGAKCIHVLAEHEGWINCCAIDATTIISGSEDEKLKIWDAESGKCVHTLAGHDDTINCCAVSGGTVLSGSEDETLKIWDASTGEEICTLEGHKDRITCCSLTGPASGLIEQLAMSGSADNTLMVWDVEEGMCLHTLKGHNASIYSGTFSACGRLIISGGWDRTVRVWKRTGEEADSSWEAGSIFTHANPVKCCSLIAPAVSNHDNDSDSKSSDPLAGVIVVSGTSEVGCVYAWDASAGDNKSEQGSGSSTSTSTSSTSSSSSIPPHTLEAVVAVGTNGLAVSASWDKTVQIYTCRHDDDVGRNQAPTELGNVVCECTMSLPLKREGDEEVATAKEVQTKGKRSVELKFREGQRVEAKYKGRGTKWYAGRVSKAYAHPGGWACYDITYDDGDTEKGAIDTNVRQKAEEDGEADGGVVGAGHSEQIFCCAVLAGGGIASGVSTPSATPAPSPTRTPTANANCHRQRSIIVTGSADNNLKLWDSDSGEHLCDLRGHQDWVHGCAISAIKAHSKLASTTTTTENSNSGGAMVMVASASRDKSVRIWLCREKPGLARSFSNKQDKAAGDVAVFSFECVRSIGLDSHQNWVYATALCPSAQMVLSGSEDNTMKLWRLTHCYSTDGDAGRGGDSEAASVAPIGLRSQLLHTFVGHTAGVTCCSFLGHTLGASGSGDGMVRVWDLIEGTCLRRLHQVTPEPVKGPPTVEPVLNCIGSPCGRWIYACTQQRLTMWAWKAATVVLQHTTGQIELNASMAVAADGRVVYSTKDGAVYMGAIVGRGTSRGKGGDAKWRVTSGDGDGSW